MIRRVHGLRAFGLLLLAATPLAAAAQQAVTVTGHVSSANMPVRGATVRIDELDLGTITDAEGRYSFIVPSARVRGQGVLLTARYLRFRPQSVRISLVGTAITQDFDLTSADQPAPGAAEPPGRPVEAPSGPVRDRPARGADAPSAPAPRASVARVRVDAPTVDSTAFAEVAGMVDLASALAGRLPGVEVSSASTPGGTSTMLVRGSRSILGLTQPLVVLNGIIIDNNNLTDASQLSGHGGFDYGSGINDLNLDDIASVRLLTGAQAVLRYGGRAANGVLLVTTKSGRGLNGVDVSASQQLSRESVLRLPSYQNTYGQGLGGKFSFFDGKGGGINDGVDQSWGPALDGSPVTQASYTEAGRPDVRAWVPLPTNVSDYFGTGSSLTTNVAVQGANETGQFRMSVSNRVASALTPQTNITHRSVLLTGGTTPSARLSLSGDVQLFSDRGEARPGSGFDVSNPVSSFAHMGRQVDVQSLQAHLRDGLGKQISWNYNGQNNPWFAVLQNDNHDDRTRYVAGGSATYAFSDWVSGTARIGTDHTSDTRIFTVAPGWMGGFPYYLGRGDFSTGGSQSTDISATQKSADVSLRLSPKPSGPLAYLFTVGAGYRGDALTTTFRGADKVSDTTAALPVAWDGTAGTVSVFAGAEALLHDYASANVTMRSESSTLQSEASQSTLYPAVFGTFDFARVDSGGLLNGKLESFVVRAGWSRRGNDATAALLQRLGVTATTAPGVVTLASAPELTTGLELGANMRWLQGRMALDVGAYSDRSENLILASGTSYERTGVVTNTGIDAAVTLVPVRAADGLEWTVGLTAGKNTNRVESLSGSVSSVLLGAPYGGVSVRALPGSSLGVLVGTRYLRDASGQPLLRNGLPLPDSVTGPQVLGETTPAWTGGLSTTIRKNNVEFSVLLDTHHGGQIFSASNMVGAYSGVLAETEFRPDSGLLIAGTDVPSGKPNTVHVQAQDYYHALGAIGERWIYDASFVKLREARVSLMLPLRFVEALNAQSMRLSIIGRNLALWTNAPNIDPETVLSASTFRGAELGQLPTARSVGFQLSLTP